MFMELDYDYIGMNLCSMSGLQVRILRDGEIVSTYQNAIFSPDPVIQVMETISLEQRNISYLVTEEFLFYGTLKVRDHGLTIVIGPTMQINPDKSRALSILHSLGEPRSRLQEFMAFLQTIPSYPLLNFVQILCSVNYFLNDEKLVPSDLLLKGDADLASRPVETAPTPEYENPGSIHNTYDYERTLFSYLRHGQTEKLRNILTAQPTGRPGKIAYDELRQQKNLFICAVTLATRAAVEGGMDKEAAFSLSDMYIQSIERLYDLNEISKLATRMLLDYSERVAETMRGGCNTQFSRNVHRYITMNLDHRISTAEIAQTLQINRAYLCEKFKQDTGKSVGIYISEQKINEAKRLLSVTDKPVVDISEHLGFSSQGYFQNVFKRATGKTPKQYRNESSA
jgi:AraC-like DNA-binding protein